MKEYEESAYVIDNGRNIKMKHLTGCGVNESWTLDDCEQKCPKYYSCCAVAEANDILKVYEERSDTHAHPTAQTRRQP